MYEELPVYRCHRAPSSITVDGAIDEPAWDAADVARPFIVADGRGPSVRPTVVRALWDHRFLYVAFDATDADIFSRFTAYMDPVSDDECVEVFISPGTALRDYFNFELSPRNVLLERHSLIGPDGSRTRLDGWRSEELRTAVRVFGTLDDRTDRDERWTAEFAIPFDQLVPTGSPPVRPGDRWRINFYRIDRSPDDEYSCWSPTLTTPARFHNPNRFGHLLFTE